MDQDDGGGSDNANAGEQVKGQRPSWMSSLPDDFKTNDVLAKYPSIGDAAKELVSFKTSEGKMVTIPGEDATEEQRQAFYEKLGRPKTADKYTISKPADLPKDIEYAPEVESAFKSFAHQHGLTNTQAKEAYNWYWGLVKNGFERREQAIKQANEAAVNKLKDEWHGDAFKINTELATRAFKKFCGESEEAIKLIDESKVDGVTLGNHPVFLKVFASIGKAISDSSLGDGGRDGVGRELTDEERAKARFPNTKF